ncbi:hypothetical protein OC846_002349 [Tilletia horrida]|uniref:AAA+ ATPase domain-containing protein n=1 Tax=Tilletia horrida TaxID=155126 RepID=A0AAN6GUA1_9BASI|nr:hypothetical protein OC845_002479 [Tilletia horrida]KAK0553818.1 hypothetical protein OC846_002349 [Tilletia horrida]KAK0567781.1 hypothetical protein OC861_002524 [Tilletia horrida]
MWSSLQNLTLLTDFSAPFVYVILYLVWLYGGWWYYPKSDLFEAFHYLTCTFAGFFYVIWFCVVTGSWWESKITSTSQPAQQSEPANVSNKPPPSEKQSSTVSWTPKAVQETLEENGTHVYIKIWNQLAREFPDHQLIGTRIELDIIKWAHSEKKLLSSADVAVLAPRQPAHLVWVAKRNVKSLVPGRPIHDGYTNFETGLRTVPQQELAQGSMQAQPSNVALEIEYNGTKIHLYFCEWIGEQGRRKFAWFAHFAGTSDKVGRDLFAEVYCWQNVLKDEIWMYDETFSKSKSLYADVMSADAEDLVLPEQTLDRLRRDTKTFFESRRIFESLQVPWKRGILLMGPPGNGKTATIKAIIRDSIGKAAILYARRLKDCRDRSTPAISAVFKHARENAPCLLIFEDLDSLVEASARSVLLNELDGLHSNEGILIIATTNHADKLDDALLNRPSRFDQKYTFDLPNEELRKKFIEKWLRERVGLGRLVFDGASQGGIDIKNAEELIDAVTAHTAGWSFAFLKELFLSFLLKVVVRHGTSDTQTEDTTIPTEKSQLDKSELSSLLKDVNIPARILMEVLDELATQVKTPVPDSPPLMIMK